MEHKSDAKSHFKYVRLYEILLEKITSGHWRPNDALPTERELSQRYDLSRITVRDALNRLEGEGYIYRRQGKGTFVALRPIDQKLTKLYTLRESIEAHGMVHTVKILSFQRIAAKDQTRDALGIAEGEEVYELIRCFYASEVAYAVESSYIPVSAFPEMTEEMIRANGLYKTMQAFSIVPERATERLTAVLADQETALLLMLPPRETVIRDERTTYCGERIIEHTVTFIKSNFFSYTVELNRGTT